MSASPAPSGEAGEGSAGTEDESLASSMQSFLTLSNDCTTALDDFRNNWQKELQRKQQPAGNEPEPKNLLSPQADADNEAEQQALAKNLFHKAVELEQRGKVYDAIPFYRKAVQIEPNIEFKYYEHQQQKNTAQKKAKDHRLMNVNADNAQQDTAGDEEDIAYDLYEKFQLDITQNYAGKLMQSSRDPGVISTETHISELPPEILLYIMRWVVTSQLDMRSLEQCAAVCKGMYLLARDEELWRSACVKVWGHNVGSPTTNTTITAVNKDPPSPDDQCPIIPIYASWRQMFLERERVLFGGCYISKTTYLRMGENSFQDQYYRPVQLVEYYRYLRFLPDGSVLMMTSADEPQQCVSRLKNLHQLRPDVLKGHYRLFGSTVTIVLNKQQQQSKFIVPSASSGAGGAYGRHRRGSSMYDEAAHNSTKYCIELRILNTNKRKFAQLVWTHYSIVQVRNKQETTSEFDLTASKYPPLRFSTVRSYHLDADAPMN